MESLLYMPLLILNRVKELRQAREWTQEQLASAVGVSRQSINSIERDRYVPGLLLALTVAKVLIAQQTTSSSWSLKSENPYDWRRDR